MPPRKPKALKREYDDVSSGSDEAESRPRGTGKDEITMKITKKAKAPKKVKTEDGGDEGGRVTAAGEPQKIGFDIAKGPVQDAELHAKYNAMTLDELKQYMKVRARPRRAPGANASEREARSG